MYNHSLIGGKHCYKHIPMGIDNPPETFKQKKDDLFHLFGFICGYIEYLFIYK